MIRGKHNKMLDTTYKSTMTLLIWCIIANFNCLKINVTFNGIIFHLTFDVLWTIMFLLNSQ